MGYFAHVWLGKVKLWTQPVNYNRRRQGRLHKTQLPQSLLFFFSVNNWSAEAKEGCIKAMIPALRGWIGALRWPLCSPGNVGRDNHWSKRKQLGLRRMNLVKDKNWSKCQINWGNKNNQFKTGVLNGLLQFQFSLIVKKCSKNKNKKTIHAAWQAGSSVKISKEHLGTAPLTGARPSWWPNSFPPPPKLEKLKTLDFIQTSWKLAGMLV